MTSADIRARRRITRVRIDELLRFLPWHGGAGDLHDGKLVLPYPSYPPVVKDFFALASQECWRDYGYEPAAAAALVQDDGAIAGASLDQIKTMLTSCVRGERFCDGHWETMIKEGRIAAILRRLEQLREDAPEA
jgi:hypothetical protein